MNKAQSKLALRINAEKDKEELFIRVKLNQDSIFKLEMLAAFWPGATLRQLNNLRKTNLWARAKNGDI